MTLQIAQRTAASVTTPPSGNLDVFMDSADGLLKYKDAAGVLHIVTGQGMSGWYDVTNYGVAAGAAAATANVTALNALIAAVPSGSTIYFPAGIWQFNSAITTLPANLTFQGEFGASQIYLIANIAANFITCNAAAGYTAFKDLQFIASVNQTAGAVIETNNGYGVLVERCNFIGGGGGAGTNLFNGISMTGAQSGNGVRILDCTINVFSNVGILAAANSFGQFVVDRCVIGGSISTGQAVAGIQLLGGGAMQLDNTDIVNCNIGLGLQPAGVGSVASVQCTNTFFDQAGTNAVLIGGSGTVLRSQFTHCWFTILGPGSTAGQPISILTTGSGIHVGIQFRDCMIWNSNANTGTSSGVLASAVADLSLTDCVIAGWTTGINITPASPAGTTKLNVVGCTIGPCGSVAGNTTGISLNAGSVAFGWISVQGNSLQGSTTPMVDNSSVTGGQKLIVDNVGMAMPSVPMVTTPATVTTTEVVVHQVAIAANALLVGTTYRVRAFGIETGTVPTLTARLRLGTAGTIADTQVCATAAATVPTGTGWSVEGYVTIRTIGSGGTALGNAIAIGNAGTGAGTSPQSATVAVSTIVANFLSLTLIGAGTSPVITVVNAVIEVVKQ